jgi:GntR family transcriptional regulator
MSMTGWAELPHGEAPLYVRLKEALRQAITSGRAPGDPFPSEAQIEAHYGISRTTVRQALSALADEGLIVRRQGKGNVVAEPKKLIVECGLLSSGRSAGSPDPGTESRVINAEVVELDGQRAGLMEVPVRTPALRVRRVHALAGEPVCYQVNYLCVADLPTPLPDADQIQGAVTGWELARTTVGARHATVEIVLADAFRAQHLNVPVGSPLILVERVGLAAGGEPVELSRSFHPGRSIRLDLSVDLPIGELNPSALTASRKQQDA